MTTSVTPRQVSGGGKYFLGWFKVAENDAKYVADQVINQHNGASAPDTFWSVEVR